MASPKLWAEVWTRPGHATFGKVIADVPVISASGTVVVNGVGEGRITIPKSYERLDEIMKSDPATPGNSVTSLIRIFSENSATPIYEFIPAVFTGEQDKADPDIEIAGPYIDVLWGYARLEPWDWSGIDDEHSDWPDWIWGGRNILGELQSTYSPSVTRFYRQSTVTAGTFIVGISFNGGAISNTNTIAWNASAAAFDTELTAELVAMGHATANLEVSGSGSEADPWRVQTDIPEGEYVFSVNSAGLTGGLVTQNRETIGTLLPVGWTTSFNPVNNLSHGPVSVFRASTYTAPDPTAPACDTTGVAIAFDGNIGMYPGIQKIVPVKPGGRYYASATAYAQGGAGTYRFVIRDLMENGIAAEPDFDTGTTLLANTWTTFDNMTSVVIPAGVDRVIVRFASVGATDPPLTFVSCLELREGMPPTNWGDILTQLYLDASTDHAPRRVWQIGAGATDFLTLDFTNLVDSAGAAWADPEVKITLKRGMNYIRAIGEAQKAGYETRIVPNSVALGTYKLQVYNTGTLGTDHTVIAAGPSIQGGRDVTRRDLRRFQVPATDVSVEAGGQNFARSRDTNAITALGRIEQYIPNQDLGSMTEAALNAAQAVAANLSRSQSLSYTLTPTTLDPEPFIAYKAGDTVYVLDPPDVPVRSARRIKSLGFTYTKDTLEYSVQLESDTYVGAQGIAQSVDFLLKEFKAIRERPDETTDPLNYFQDGDGGMATIAFAPTNSSTYSKGKADYTLPGVNDLDFIQGILDTFDVDFAGVGLQVWLYEGTVRQSMAGKTTHGLRFKAPTVLRGMGMFATTIFCYDTVGPASANLTLIHSFGQVCTITDLQVSSATVTTNPFDLIKTTHEATIERVLLSDSPRDGLVIAGGQAPTMLTHVWVDGAEQDGISLSSSAVSAFGVKTEQCFRHGVYASSSSGALVGCTSNGNAENGFNLDGFSGQLIGCKTEGNTLSGIFGENCEELAIVGCEIVSDDEFGINLELSNTCLIDSTVVRAASENESGTGMAIRLFECNEITIGPTTVVDDCWEDGIVLIDSSNCRIMATVLASGMSADNTFDNVRIEATIDETDAQYNHIQVHSRPSPAGGNLTRYGVNVDSGFCNRVVGCDFGVPGQYGTNAYVNTPASTQNTWPNDAYYGDNLIDCGEESPPEEPEGGEDDVTAPAVPVGLTAAPGDTFVFLNWTSNTELDMASYKVYKATASGGPFTLLTTVDDSEHTDTGLVNGTPLWFKITAVDSSGNESAMTASVTATPVIPPVGVAPAVPTGLAVVSTGDTVVGLNWTSNIETDLDHYEVYQATASGGPYVSVGSPTVSDFTVVGLTNGTPYWWKVSAVDTGSNESAQSSSVTTTPTAGGGVVGRPTPTVVFNAANLYSAAKVTAEAAGTVFGFEADGGTGSGPRYESAAIPTKDNNEYVASPGVVLDGNGSTPLAFLTDAATTGVKIWDFEWTDYTGQDGAGNNNDKGGGAVRLRDSWELIDCYGHHNKYGAFRIDGDDVTITGGVYSYNGQYGFAGGNCDDCTVDGTELHHNGGISSLDIGGDTGGCKIVHSERFTFVNVESHHNLATGTQGGNGLWTDINNLDTVYDTCDLHDNEGAGIFHEVSLGFEIRDCTLTNNGQDNSGGGIHPVKANIQISNSGGNSGWIHDNVITCDDSQPLGHYGISLFNSNHFQWTANNVTKGCLGTRNVLIEDNTIDMSGSQWKAAIAITGNLPTARHASQFCGQVAITASGSNNRIRNNTETLADGAHENTPYIRAGVRVSASAWAGFGYT